MYNGHNNSITSLNCNRNRIIDRSRRVHRSKVLDPNLNKRLNRIPQTINHKYKKIYYDREYEYLHLRPLPNRLYQHNTPSSRFINIPSRPVLSSHPHNSPNHTNIKSFIIPSDHVKYLVGPGGNVLKHLNSNGIIVKFTPNSDHSKTTVTIESESHHVSNIENNLKDIINHEMKIVAKKHISIHLPEKNIPSYTVNKAETFKFLCTFFSEINSIPNSSHRKPCLIIYLKNFPKNYIKIFNENIPDILANFVSLKFSNKREDSSNSNFSTLEELIKTLDIENYTKIYNKQMVVPTNSLFNNEHSTKNSKNIIPGFGESKNSISKKRVNKIALNSVSKKKKEITTPFSINEVKKVKELTVEKQIKRVIQWLKVCHTYTISLNSFLSSLIIIIINNLIKNTHNEALNKIHRSKEFISNEKMFFRLIQSAISRSIFIEKDRIVLKEAILHYPRYPLLNLPPFSSVSKIKQPSNQHIASKPDPSFILKPTGICSNCSKINNIFMCNWCSTVFCKTCINITKPPCSNCQKNLSKEDKIAINSYISFEQGKEKMISSFNTHEQDFEEISFNLPLYDVFSLQRIEIPVKGKNCKHRDTFDLKTFLARKVANKCPICDKRILVSELEVDRYISRILATEPDDVREVTIMNDGTWKTVNPKKEEKDIINIKNTENRESNELGDECVDLS